MEDHTTALGFWGDLTMLQRGLLGDGSTNSPALYMTLQWTALLKLVLR